MKKVLLMAALAAVNMSMQAQEQLKVSWSGRALFDGATYTQNDAAKEQNGEMNEGFAVRDFRLGFKAVYGKWTLRGEAALANNEVSLKDFYLQYNFNKKNYIRAGHYTVPFGLSSAYGSADKEYMDEPEGNIFQVGRRIGVMHTVWNNPLWVQYGAFADNSALTKSTDKTGPQGYTLAGRFVWRPIMTDDGGFHVGISGNHVKAESNSGNHAHIAYSKKFLTAVDKTTATSIDITDARWENKATVEFQGLYKNWQLASQYYWSHIARDGGNKYNSNGFYVSLRGILTNVANYTYNYGSAGVDHPSNKNLELALGYGFLNLYDKNAFVNSYIDGLANAGKMQDFTIGLSYFLNKYITLRINYHNISVQRHSTEAATLGQNLDKQNVNVFQFRVQYKL